jgi:hypothetical protein
MYMVQLTTAWCSQFSTVVRYGMVELNGMVRSNDAQSRSATQGTFIIGLLSEGRLLLLFKKCLLGPYILLPNVVRAFHHTTAVIVLIDSRLIS